MVSGIGISNALCENYQLTNSSALATIPMQGKEKDNHKEVVSQNSNHKDVQEVHAELVDIEVEVVNGGIQKQSTSVSELSNDKLHVVDDAPKILDSLSLDPENDVPSVRAYMKLLEAIDKRTDTIGRLRFEIQLNEKRRSEFDLLRPKKELVEEVPPEPFVPLTKEEEVEVARAFSTNMKKILVSHENSNTEISAKKFQCLRPSGWLNDEVINLYFELLKERERREPQKFLNCHFLQVINVAKEIL